MKNNTIFQFIKPVTQFIERKMVFVFSFLNKHYTPLAVIVMIILGFIFFYITSYLLRYNHWNYWLWKNRALTKAIYFSIVLISIKILIGVM